MNNITPATFSGIVSLLQKHFGDNKIQASTLPDLEHQITALVSYLLRTNLNKLLHILYIADVEEQKVKMALKASGSEEEIAATIARLIIKRELQKVQTRFMYKQRH